MRSPTRGAQPTTRRQRRSRHVGCMTRLTAITAFAILTVAVPIGLSEGHQDGAAALPSAPTITFVDEPSVGAREMIGWAIERYLEVGIQLPDLEISFPATCAGKAGRYIVGRNQVELCSAKPKLILHELAHSWDDNSTIDREAFLELRGLDHWYEQSGRDSTESGGEQLAHIIAWGLLTGRGTTTSLLSPVRLAVVKSLEFCGGKCSTVNTSWKTSMTSNKTALIAMLRPTSIVWSSWKHSVANCRKRFKT